jgi:lactase-phlorizin hydrolase
MIWFEKNRSGSPWLKITPFGLRNLLGWLRDKFNNPEMIITENGYSDTAGNLDDMLRIYYYKHYINNVLKGIYIMKSLRDPVDR